MKDKVQNPVIDTPSALQLLDLSNQVGKAVCRYLVSSNITKERFAQIKGSDVDAIGEKAAHEILGLVSTAIMFQKDLIKSFYLEVFDLKVDLTKVAFPEKEGFVAHGYNTHKFNIDQIMAAYAKKWDINVYKYMNPATKKINHQQERPKGPYVFAHRGGDKPDTEHLNKSFDDAMAAGFPFANAEEYLLMTGLHKFVKGYFMDKKSWTRTSSLWSDGSLVVGGWLETGGRLYLDSGRRGSRDAADGPREIVLFS